MAVWSNLAPGCADLASHEPPAYGIVLIDDDSVAVHLRDYLDDSPCFPF